MEHLAEHFDSPSMKKFVMRVVKRVTKRIEKCEKCPTKLTRCISQLSTVQLCVAIPSERHDETEWVCGIQRKSRIWGLNSMAHSRVQRLAAMETAQPPPERTMWPPSNHNSCVPWISFPQAVSSAKRQHTRVARGTHSIPSPSDRIKDADAQLSDSLALFPREEGSLRACKRCSVRSGSRRSIGTVRILQDVGNQSGIGLAAVESVMRVVGASKEGSLRALVAE